MKTKKVKTKKSIKKIKVGGKPVRIRFNTKARTKSAGQTAASRIGCPGVSMYRTTSRIIGGPRGAGPTAAPMMVLQLIAQGPELVQHI